MAEDAMLRIKTGLSAKTRTVKTGSSSGVFVPGSLWHLIPDVSLRTGTGLAALAAAALIGVATALGALWMAVAPDEAHFLAAHIISLCRFPLGASEEAPFLTANRTAMTAMMTGMDIGPSGDVDRDFVAMMVPHHHGAIDMAQTVLRYGHNGKIRRLAQEIIVTQQQEIAVMRLAVGEPLPPSIPAPTVPTVASGNY